MVPSIYNRNVVVPRERNHNRKIETISKVEILNLSFLLPETNASDCVGIMEYIERNQFCYGHNPVTGPGRELGIKAVGFMSYFTVYALVLFQVSGRRLRPSIKAHVSTLQIFQSSATMEQRIVQQQTEQTHRTQYMEMLLEVEYIPLSHKFFAGLFHWMLLAGYLVIPGTFTSLQKSDTIKSALNGSEMEKTILHTIQNPPLLAIACSLLAVGVAGMSWLGWIWRHNYIWLINYLFPWVTLVAPQEVQYG